MHGNTRHLALLRIYRDDAIHTIRRLVTFVLKPIKATIKLRSISQADLLIDFRKYRTCL